MRILHAIHDFLPRHQAGSEIYVSELCRELARAHHVTVLCAEYDPSRRHGHVQWRVHNGLAVVEIVNNWVCRTFEDTYRPPLIGDRIADVLRAVQPDIVHVHNLLNLSFDLPAMAHAQGIPVVATLHDYALVCPSGGQRIHRADRHICHVIDTGRCARCFGESPVHAHIAYGQIAAAIRAPGLVHRTAVATRRRLPALVERATALARRAASVATTTEDVDKRLAAARRLFDQIDLFVAPSRSIAGEFERLGVKADRIRISDYGFADSGRGAAVRPSLEYDAHDGFKRHRPLRIGYVGTLVWHKGVHVLLEAIRSLQPEAYELRIFGNPDVFPDYTADLRALAAGLPVHFLGAFARERTAEVYAQIDLLVVPSLWLENSPLVIHEAFVAGVPVVAARIGGIVDLVDDGRTGRLYDSTSAGELAAVLRQLIGDRDQLRTMTSLARTAPVKSIGDDAREWEERYAAVLGSRAAVGRAT